MKKKGSLHYLNKKEEIKAVIVEPMNCNQITKKLQALNFKPDNNVTLRKMLILMVNEGTLKIERRKSRDYYKVINSPN